MTTYIGIAGVTAREQIDAIVDGYPHDAPPLAMGVLASYKTAILRQPNKYPNRYPRWDQIRDIWSDDRRVRNVLHYSFAEDDVDPPRSARLLADDLDDLRDATWPRDLWLQVNARPMIRPWQAAALARVAPEWGRIIVQVSDRAMNTSFVHVANALEALADHKEKVSLLFDGSGGKGLEANIRILSGWIGFFSDMGWDCGFAGGLSPETLPAYAPLFDICPGLSVDTESWPRDVDDRLVIGKAIAFRDAARGLHR